ncbi:hypothetical protein J6590_042518 [Homalodisca vitripennis]|nr:hypothetical protein J6590_042518 [Homalodisca vitripennis]
MVNCCNNQNGRPNLTVEVSEDRYREMEDTITWSECDQTQCTMVNCCNNQNGRPNLTVEVSEDRYREVEDTITLSDCDQTQCTMVNCCNNQNGRPNLTVEVSEDRYREVKDTITWSDCRFPRPEKTKRVELLQIGPTTQECQTPTIVEHCRCLYNSSTFHFESAQQAAIFVVAPLEQS